MKRTLTLFLAFFAISLLGSYNTAVATHATENVQLTNETVLICKSTSATVYHKYMCSGLKRCTHSIVKVDVADAVKFGRRACKICYR